MRKLISGPGSEVGSGNDIRRRTAYGVQEKPSGGMSVKSKWGAPDLIAQGQKAEGLVTEELELLGWDPDKSTLRQRR